MEGTTVEKAFALYDAAVEHFYAAGGATISAIRSPHALFDQFRASLPIEFVQNQQYLGMRIEAVDTQSYVSVRGTSHSGNDFEWPEP